MLVGGTVGQLVGDPLISGSLTRSRYSDIELSVYTFSQTTSLIDLYVSNLLKDGDDLYYTSFPISVLNNDANSAAVYGWISNNSIIESLDDDFKNPTGRCRFNRISTEYILSSFLKAGLFVEGFFTRGSFFRKRNITFRGRF